MSFSCTQIYLLLLSLAVTQYTIALEDDQSQVDDSLLLEQDTDKRGWHDLGTTFGKRAGWHDLQTSWGKRAAEEMTPLEKRTWHDLSTSFGKRGWHDLGTTFGKRDSTDAIDDLSGLLEKRNWHSLSTAFGKRNWHNLSTAFGKRRPQEVASAEIIESIITQQLFTDIDVDENGCIDKEELRELVRKLLIGEL